MVPDASRSSLGLEYFLWDKDEEWRWSQDRLIELGIKECAQIGLIEPDEVEDGTIVRMKKAYPVYDHKYQESLATVRRYLETFSNLQTVGRNGLHRYNNQDHSMLTGVYAARNIVGEKNDVWAVNTEMEYHEEVRRPASSAGDRLVPARIVPETPSLEISANDLVRAAFAKLDPVALGAAIGIVAALGIFLTSVVLLLKGGPTIGPTLSLLGNYLPGFETTWQGAFIGTAEAGIGGFAFGFIIASLRNWVIAAYASLLKRRAELAAQQNLLEKI